jgi:hypothetical protein
VCRQTEERVSRLSVIRPNAHSGHTGATADVHRASPQPPPSTLLGHSASHSERLFLPHTRRSQYSSGPAQLDGRPTFPEAKEAAKSRRNPPFARAVSDIARVSPPLLPNRATTPAPPCAGTGDASPVLGSTGHRTAGTKRQPRPGCSPRDAGTRRPSPLTSKRARLLTRGTSKCHDPASFSFLLQL